MSRALGIGLILLSLAVGPAGAPAAPAPAAVRLDLPFVPQTPRLCGPAAVAMVVRYWNGSRVDAADLAAPDTVPAAGLDAEELARILEEAGFSVSLFAGDLPLLLHHLEKGRPLVVLVDGGGTLHWVTVAGWTGRAVLIHDPAVGPWRHWSREDFLQRWKASGNLALLALPPDGAAGPPATDAAPEPEASQSLDDETLWLRRAAGQAWASGRYAAAEEAASRAVARGDRTGLSAVVLGACRYRRGARREALAAWNPGGRPRVEDLELEGLRRTRDPVVRSLAGLRDGALLTPGTLLRTRRRLARLPAARRTRVTYRVLESGTAVVEAAVWERPRLPGLRSFLAANAVRAVSERSTALSVVSPTGSGEVWRLRGRWWEGRPGLFLSLAAPVGRGMVATVRGEWEEQRYADPAAGEVREKRRAVRLGLGSWLTGRQHLGLEAGLHRVDGRGRALLLRLRGLRAGVGGAWALRGGLSLWKPLSGGPSALRFHLGAGWRRRLGPLRLDLRGDRVVADAGAPRFLWPGAGVGVARAFLLRAHPLLAEGVITGPAFAPRLDAGTAELRAPLARALASRLHLALFTDAARPGGGPWWVDVGTGVRVDAAWLPGEVAVDLAWGTDDGERALSLRWTASLEPRP